MILVTGATGTAGREIVKALSARRAGVRVLVRDEAMARAVLGPGVETAVGDLRSPATVAAALDGIERAVLLAPNTPDQVQMETGFVEAAKRAGVGHVVEFSGLGADLDSAARIARAHAMVERALEDSGIPFTHLRPNTFMQNILGAAPAIASHGSLPQPMGDLRVSLVDVRDIAAVAATVLTEPGHTGRTYTITGPAALSFTDVARALSRAIGRDVAYVDIAPPDFKRVLMSAGTDAWLADALLELLPHVSARIGSLVTDVIAEVTGKPATSFEQFARDYAGVFS